jgi:hypothetical protein
MKPKRKLAAEVKWLPLEMGKYICYSEYMAGGFTTEPTLLPIEITTDYCLMY